MGNPTRLARMINALVGPSIGEVALQFIRNAHMSSMTSSGTGDYSADQKSSRPWATMAGEGRRRLGDLIQSVDSEVKSMSAQVSLLVDEARVKVRDMNVNDAE